MRLASDAWASTLRAAEGVPLCVEWRNGCCLVARKLRSVPESRAGRDSSLVPFSDVSGQEGRAMRSMLVHVELEHRGALVLASLPRHGIHFNTIERTGRRFDEAQAPRDGV